MCTWEVGKQVWSGLGLPEEGNWGAGAALPVQELSSEGSSALLCHQPVRQPAKELGRKETREASKRKNIPLENF